MLDRFLCIRVATFSLIGYCSAIAGPTFVDPKLRSQVLYGARSYPHGWIWWLFAPVAFVLPYIALRFFESKEAWLVSSITPLIILGAAAAFSFPPERPHMGILVCTFGFALIILVTVACSVSASDFAYAADTAIPFESRLERVKATASFWQMISVYGAAGYLAFAVAWLYALWFMTEKFVGSAEDRFRLGQSQVAVAVAVSICVVVGPILEAFSNAFEAMLQLSTVKK